MTYSQPDDGVYAIVALTKNEAVAGGLLLMQANRRRFALSIVMLALAVVIASTGSYVLALLFAFYAALFGTSLLFRWTYGRLYKLDRYSGEAVRYRFDPTGFAMSGSGFEARYSWHRVEKVVENEKVIVFVLGRGRGLTVPKRCIDPSQVARVGAMARQVPPA